MAVPEYGLDFSIRNSEREPGFILEIDSFIGSVIVEHALPDDIQKEGAVIYGIDEVHVTVNDFLSAADYGRETFPLERPRVQDAEPTHTGNPQFRVSKEAYMVCLVFCWNVFHRIVLAGYNLDIHSIVCYEIQIVLLVNYRFGIESVEVPQNGAQGAVILFIQEQGLTVGGKDFSVSAFVYFGNIPVPVLEFRPAEEAVFSTVCDAVDCGNPQHALGRAQDVVDLIVRQAQCVIGTEVLVIF